VLEGKRDLNRWEYDETTTGVVNSFFALEPERVPIVNDADNENYLEVTKLPGMLQRDEQDTGGSLVITPSVRALWTAVYKARPAGSRHIVVGAPGHGKSRSLTYFIKLIYRMRSAQHDLAMPVIVLEHRKDRRVSLFAPKNPTDRSQGYEAFTSTLTNFEASFEPALNVATNYYLVDSAAAEGSKMPPLVGSRTVFVCSPDPRHYDEFRKHCSEPAFYFPIWSEAEIVAANPYM
jgi:hypothetical protein